MLLLPVLFRLIRQIYVLYRAQIVKDSCSVTFHISRVQSVSLDLPTYSPDTLIIFPFRNHALHRMILYKFHSEFKNN